MSVYPIDRDTPYGGLSALQAMKGRFGDDGLVHVNRQELGALEKLNGGPLSTNPETGLPEAFGLREMLPMAAGIAASIFAP
jgi:hypothetical protein